MKDFLEEISLEELQQITDRLQLELDTAEAKLKSAEKAYGRAHDKHSIYSRMLSFRKRQLEEVNETKEISQPESSLDKTAAILELVQRSGSKGIMPREIEAALRESGVKLKEGYVYAILSRLKKRGQVLSKEGRYFSA